MKVPILLRVVASVFDIAIVNRWTHSVGIPDQATYIIGVDMVYEVLCLFETKYRPCRLTPLQMSSFGPTQYTSCILARGVPPH